MIEISWQKFEAKFGGKAPGAFQDLCLYVFCHLLDLNGGVFSYADHAGMETTDVLFKGKYTGFQAKFYTAKLSNRKQDILDSIIATRAHNSRVQKIIFFLPIDPSGVSKGVDEGQKPKWMLEAEKTAEMKHLEIEWFGTSRFKVVLAHEDLQYIARHFFDLDADLWDFVATLKERTAVRLSCIHNAIPFRGETIHLGHKKELERLSKNASSTITIISGIGGVGKTAIVKDWLQQHMVEETCAFVLQPNEVIEQFNDINISRAWHATLDTFLTMVARSYEQRILVVDSAEKMEKGEEQPELLMVLHRFVEAGWKILLTTRTLFEKQIVSRFQTFLPESGLEVLNVSPISEDELNSLSIKYNFPLPANLQVRDAIRTAFNLSAYLSCKQSNEATSLMMFWDIVWLHFVLNDNPTDTAGQTFCQYVESKLRKDASIVDVASPSEDTKRLVERGILAPRENRTGYLITHDVYEEWATVRLLDGKLEELGLSEFEKYIASSHDLRHGLQLQIEQRLAGMGQDGDPLIQWLLVNKSDTLRSDLLLALVHSEYVGKFLQTFSKLLLEKESTILESIIAGVYNFGRGPEKISVGVNRQRPEGLSWPTIIEFASSHQAALQEIKTPTLLSLMQDWVLSNPNDDTAGICSRFGWNAIEIGKPLGAYSYQWEEQLADLLLASSGYDKPNFENQIRQHLAVYPDKRNGVLDMVCKRLLKPQSPACIVAIKHFPQLIRDVAWAYWRPKRDSHRYYDHFDRIEVEYGLSRNHIEYFPPSPYQGPTYLLLKLDSINTIRFIIDFVNACISDAARVNPDRFDRIILCLPNGQKVGQNISLGLWNCYRDKGDGEHVPYLLKALHMALEQFLLELSENRANDELCEAILWFILQRSISASLTAVVASVVMAHPMEFVKIGLVLVSERKVFWYDFRRHLAEQRPDPFQAFLPFPKQVHDYYREEADKHPVRKETLERVILQYQIVPSKVVPDLRERVHRILDGYAVGWDNMSPEDKFWLTRIDVRRQNLRRVVDAKTKQTYIVGEPILSQDMVARQKESSAFSEEICTMAHLQKWGENRIQERLPPANDAYSDIRNVLKDFQWLWNKASSETDGSDIVRTTALRIASSALIMFHFEALSKQVRIACEQILNDALNMVLEDDWSGRLEGVNVAIFAMPYLLSHLRWWKRRPVLQRFVMALLNEDEGDFWGRERICDWGMAGIRGYCNRMGDSRFRQRAMRAYQRHFFHYQAYRRYVNTPRKRSLVWKVRTALAKIPKILHLPSLSSSLESTGVTSIHRFGFHNGRYAYRNSFVAQNYLLTKPTEEDRTHFACNAIGFYYPAKLETKDEQTIVSNVKRVLELIFCDERVDGCISKHLHLSQMGRAYMRQLGYCALHMSSEGVMALLKELAKVPQAFRKPELLEEFLVVRYGLLRSDNFWLLWNGLLPIVAKALAKDSCRYDDSQRVLDLMTLKPLYWEGNEEVWEGEEREILAFFESLVSICGCHRYLAVAISKFVYGVGKRFVLQSLQWIAQIIVQSQGEYDYGGENAQKIKTNFEKLIPQIESRMQDIKNDTRTHLILILDYLVTQNSLPAFRMRESLFAQSHV